MRAYSQRACLTRVIESASIDKVASHCHNPTQARYILQQPRCAQDEWNRIRGGRGRVHMRSLGEQRGFG